MGQQSGISLTIASMLLDRSICFLPLPRGFSLCSTAPQRVMSKLPSKSARFRSVVCFLKLGFCNLVFWILDIVLSSHQCSRVAVQSPGTSYGFLAAGRPERISVAIADSACKQFFMSPKWKLPQSQNQTSCGINALLARPNAPRLTRRSAYRQAPLDRAPSLTNANVRGRGYATTLISKLASWKPLLQQLRKLRSVRLDAWCCRAVRRRASGSPDTRQRLRPWLTTGTSAGWFGVPLDYQPHRQ